MECRQCKYCVFMINRIDSFFEQKNGNKYLNVPDTVRSNEILKKYEQVYSGIISYQKN